MSDDEIEKRLLDAAERLLLRFGYDKTTLDDVAREAGVSRSTLYTRWKKKEALFLALLWRAGVQYAEELFVRLETDSRAGTVGGFFAMALDSIRENPLMRVLYTQDRRLLGTLILQTDLTQLYTRRIASTQAFLHMMQQAGMVRQEVDVQTLAYLTNSLQLGILKMSEVMPYEAQPPLDLLMEQAMHLIEAYTAPPHADPETGRAAMRAYVALLRQQMASMRDALNVRKQDTNL